MPKPSCKKTQS